MKRLMISVAASLLLVLALVLPAAAADPPGPGCSDFGAASGGAGFGKVISYYARLGMVSTIVNGEHTGAPGFPLLCSRP